MISDMDIGWLYASAAGPQTKFVDLTFELPNIPVVATTAVSALSVGVYERVPGSVATYVREYGQFTGPFSVKVVDVAPDPANNVYYVEDCAFVRFRLTVFQATAWAQACVFRFPGVPPPAPAKPDWKRRYKLAEYRISDASPDGKFGLHRVFALRRGSVLRVDRLVKRSAREAAAYFGIPQRRVKIARERTARPEKTEARHVF